MYTIMTPAEASEIEMEERDGRVREEKESSLNLKEWCSTSIISMLQNKKRRGWVLDYTIPLPSEPLIKT